MNHRREHSSEFWFSHRTSKLRNFEQAQTLRNIHTSVYVFISASIHGLFICTHQSLNKLLSMCIYIFIERDIYRHLSEYRFLNGKVPTVIWHRPVSLNKTTALHIASLQKHHAGAKQDLLWATEVSFGVSRSAPRDVSDESVESSILRRPANLTLRRLTWPDGHWHCSFTDKSRSRHLTRPTCYRTWPYGARLCSKRKKQSEAGGALHFSFAVTAESRGLISGYAADGSGSVAARLVCKTAPSMPFNSG